jgi:hypothetical protein
MSASTHREFRVLALQALVAPHGAIALRLESADSGVGIPQVTQSRWDAMPRLIGSRSQRVQTGRQQALRGFRRGLRPTPRVRVCRASR